MPLKLKAKKEEARDELRLLNAADKDLTALMALRDTLVEVGRLVARHNSLVAENEGLKTERGRSKRNGIVNAARALKLKLVPAGQCFILAQLQDETDYPFLKNELRRLLHIASALKSQYGEILHTVMRNSRTKLTVSSSQLDYFAEAIVKAGQVIHNREQSLSAS